MRKGLFTAPFSAAGSRRGFPKKATLFLDEVGELTVGTRNYAFACLAGAGVRACVVCNHPIRANVRVIAAATNRDLEAVHRLGTISVAILFTVSTLSD